MKVVLFSTIGAAAYDFGFAGLLYLSTRCFFKEDTSYGKMLAIVGGKVLLDSVFIVAGVVIMILSSQLGMFVISFGMIFTTIISIMAYNKVSTLSDTKKVYGYFIAYAILVLIIMLVVYILAGSMASAGMNSLQDLMNPMGSGMYEDLY